MSLGNDPSINSALRRLERLSSLDEQQLTELARAADMAGKKEVAGEAYAVLQHIWHSADPGIPGLTEAVERAH